MAVVHNVYFGSIAVIKGIRYVTFGGKLDKYA